MRRKSFGAVLAVLVTLAGCSNPPVHPAAIEVSAPQALADAPTHLRVTGLGARDRVTVTMRAAAYDGKPWSSHADYTADQAGVVDLDRAAPTTGTYAGADPMGLEWSMSQDGATPDVGSYLPVWPELQPSYDIHVAVTVHGKEVARTDLHRTWLAPGVTARAYADRPAGELYLPPPDSRSRTGVLVFGGSEGGNSLKHTAAVLASHGHPAFALAYFGVAGLPSTLRDIPLEYFASAIDALRRDGHVDKVVLMAYSRGTEAALLTAVAFPGKVDGLVLYSPSDQVNGSFPSGGSAWTLHGRAEDTGPITVDGLHMPVLSIAGGLDQLWPSATMATDLARHAPGAQPPRLFPDAGHLVGTFPYLPTGTWITRLGGTTVSYGGTRQADERAREDSWPQVLALLAAAG